MSNEKEIVVSGVKALEIADVLNATTLKILELLKHEPLYIATISEKLELSDAYVSEQIRALEDLKLVSINYTRGNRGIRKICTTTLEKITIILKDEEPSSSVTEEKFC